MIPLYDACHEKTDLKVFIIVIPKEGWAWPPPSFFWYDNDKDLQICFLVRRIIYAEPSHAKTGLKIFVTVVVYQVTLPGNLPQVTRTCPGGLLAQFLYGGVRHGKFLPPSRTNPVVPHTGITKYMEVLPPGRTCTCSAMLMSKCAQAPIREHCCSILNQNDSGYLIM